MIIQRSGTGTFPQVRSVSATATNAAATITLAAAPSLRHHILGIIWSYSATPTGGKITSTGLNGDQLDFDITVSGPGPVITPPAIGTTNASLALTLAAGGSGVVGKITVFYVDLP